MTKTVLKRMVKEILKGPAVELCAHWPSTATIAAMRRLNDIQLTTEELRAIIAAVKHRAPCEFLVFGLGYDSILWSKVNHGGTTVFLEDIQDWLREITQRHPRITAYRVEYGTQRAQWRELLQSPSVFEVDLPQEVMQTQFDVVLVDGPAGFGDSTPGRMKSIAVASRLARLGGDVFVHDCDREVEQVCCDRFLGNENLSVEVGVLRHYRIASRRL